MLADTAEYSYRKPIETVNAVIDILRVQWSVLDDTAHGELTSILTNYRAALYQAAGDIARGTVMINLTYALEAASALPADALTRLKADHRSKVSSRLESYGSHEARIFTQGLEPLIGPMATPVPVSAPSGDMDVFADAADAARRVIERFNRDWSWLSLGDQDKVFMWLRSYDDGLANAADDLERLVATYDFLHLVKLDASVFALVEDQYVVRGGLLGTTPFGQGAVMSDQDASGIRNLIDRNPMAAVPMTPWPAPTAILAESSPPPLLPQPPIETGETTLQPEVVNFHTDVRFPGQVRTFDRAIPLRVRLTLQKAEGSVVDATASFEFITPEPLPVLVVCNAEGFVEETNDLTRTIMVYRDRDSQTAIFLLTPDPDAGPGTRRISLDFYHRERLAGTASFQVEVRDRPPIDEAQAALDPLLEDRSEGGSVTDRVEGGMVLASADAPKPDFVLRIALSADRRQLSYTLHSPTGRLGLVYQRMGSVTLESDPRTFMENTLQRLSQMARASRKKLSEAEFAENQETLSEIGWDLYEQLFTPALRRTYRDLRRLRQEQPDLSLLLVSDEPWIPWEMILPHEDDLPDEDFLCAQFRMTRWLAGRGLPEDFSLHQARVVVPKSNLSSVKAEQDFFSQELPKLRDDISYGGEWLDMASEVTEALRAGDVQLFHFACHGDFDYTRPDESVLKLQGDSLRPSQIVGPMRTGVAHSKPLVFLNACHTGQTGFSLTNMGGWAARFVRAGASAFIGSLWEVNDELAALFAIRFYTDLLAGQTLGDAFHAARVHIRKEDRANPTWLAYTLYADPNGRVKPADR